MVSDVVHGTEEWHRKRSEGITGTDIGILMGLNPYKSEEQLLLSKLGVGKSFAGNSATRCGQALESLVANRWAHRNKTIIMDGVFTISDINPRYVGSPDFLTGFGGGLEIKTGAEKTYRYGIPPYYVAQGQWYAMVTQRDTWAISCLIVPKDRSLVPLGADQDYLMDWVSRRPIVEMVYERDSDVEERMRAIADAFLGRIDKLRARNV